MTTVPEVLTALTALGVATIPGAQTVNGDLTSIGSPTTERLFLVGDEDFDIESEFDSLGGVTTTEHYVVPCSISADLPTPDQSLADAQVWSDYRAIRAAIKADPSLGLSGSFSLRAAVVGVRTFRRGGTSNVRSALARFGVDVFAAND